MNLCHPSKSNTNFKRRNAWKHFLWAGSSGSSTNLLGSSLCTVGRASLTADPLTADPEGAPPSTRETQPHWAAPRLLVLPSFRRRLLCPPQARRPPGPRLTQTLAPQVWGRGTGPRVSSTLPSDFTQLGHCVSHPHSSLLTA